MKKRGARQCRAPRFSQGLTLSVYDGRPATTGPHREPDHPEARDHHRPGRWLGNSKDQIVDLERIDARRKANATNPRIGRHARESNATVSLWQVLVAVRCER